VLHIVLVDETETFVIFSNVLWINVNFLRLEKNIYKSTSLVDLWKNKFILIWLKDLNFDGLQQKGC